LDPWDIEDDGTATPLPSGVMHGEDQIFQLHRILKPNGIVNLQVCQLRCSAFAHSIQQIFTDNLLFEPSTSIRRSLSLPIFAQGNHRLEKTHGSLAAVLSDQGMVLA
jgi:hypothetical protein